jgi:hypothetical protein
MKTKILLLVSVTCFIYTIASAQFSIKQQKTMGSNSDDLLWSTCLTKDGGLIAGGSSFGDISGEKTENGRGSEDYWIVKLDSAQHIQWDKTLGGNSFDEFFSLQQTYDGGYIVCGSSFSDKSGDKTENSRGSDDYWVVKLDSTGIIEWDKTIGGSNFESFPSVQQTKDSGYILGGTSYSDISGEKTQNSKGSGDYWIVKLDKYGNIKWDKTIGGNNTDNLFSLQQTNDNGYILGGHSYSGKSGDKTENDRGGEFFDYWVVKLDSAGNIQWDKTIGGNNNDYLYCVRQTSDTGYILGGYSGSNKSGDKSENNTYQDINFTYFDYWVVKLDSKGSIEWDKTVGKKFDDYLFSVQQTKNGDYVLGGSSDSSARDGRTGETKNIYDYWVVRLNSMGQVLTDKTIGGDSPDYLYSIKEADNGLLVLAGYSSSGISGDKTESSRGGDDYWIVYLNYDSTTLPVTITNLKAYQQNDVVKINWTSLTEINMARYEIERSAGTFNFNTIGNIAAAANDAHEKSYTFSDLQPLQGNNYYRIKMIDKDGKTTYTNTILVKIINKSVFSIYPVPARDVLHIYTNSKATVCLINQSGNILLTKTIEGTGTINVHALPAGIYYLKNKETGDIIKVLAVK